MAEENKENKNSKNKEIKAMTDFEMKDLEKSVENYMRFKVVKNQKTSLVDPLDILIKEPSLIPIEKQIEKYKSNEKDKNIIEEIKTKKYPSGFEINYILDKNGQIEIKSINKDSIDENLLKNLENDLDSNLDFYIRKIYSKFNYSSIIKRVFGTKITFAELEELSVLWRYYIELKIKDDEKLITEFRKKLFKILTNNIKLLIRNIFSIMRIREAIHTIGILFQEHYFYLLKKCEIREKEMAYDMRTTYLDPIKETSGNGACFILIKELKRALNMLLYSSKYLYYSFEFIFNNNFNFMYMILRKIFYVFFERNCHFSSLLYNMKAIFVRSDMKEVCDEIDKLTLPFEYDFESKFIKEEYKNIEFEDPKEYLFNSTQCFDQLGYSVDINDEKGEEIIIETEEEKKVKEIKNLDELIKYIESDTSTKKKKKKKKKKEDPINILLKLRQENQNFDDETISQSSLSYISQDSVINNFKKDLKRETKNNNYEKIKPNFSENFVYKFD